MTSPQHEMVERATEFMEHWGLTEKHAHVTSALAALLTSERGRALEEAAKVCDVSVREYEKGVAALKIEGFKAPVTANCAQAVRICADEIRSLKPTPGREG